MSDTRDPWAGEAMSRSDAQRRYSNLVQYQLRPMVFNRRLEDTDRTQLLKRIATTAQRFRYESGVVAQSGTREEVTDLLKDYLKPESIHSEEMKDWVKRCIRSFGGVVESGE